MKSYHPLNIEERLTVCQCFYAVKLADSAVCGTLVNRCGFVDDGTYRSYIGVGWAYADVGTAFVF